MLAAMLCVAAPLFGQNTFFDDFGTSGNQLDMSQWTTEFGSPSYLGRTQLRDWVHDSGQGPFVVTGGLSQLRLDTYNPTGFSLYGTHGRTLSTFRPTLSEDIVLTVRMQLTTLQQGLVYGIYFYGCDYGPCDSLHDELDIELVTNYLQTGHSLQVQLNRYAADPLGAGNGQLVDLPSGFAPTGFHEWKIRWGLDRVTYSVDGTELLSVTTHVPHGNMWANIIAWGPAEDWPGAFHASLQPIAMDQQQHFTALVDYVAVAPAPRKTTGGQITSQ